jgi:hypothetical protein
MARIRQESAESCKGAHGSKKYEKTRAARLDRRMAKKDPGGAPRKRKYSGWSW